MGRIRQLGAILGKIKNYPRLPPTALTHPGWPDLPARLAPTFVSASPVTLKVGTKLYRVFGGPSHKAGWFWSKRHIPSTEAVWRKDDAVQQSWNSGTRMVVGVVRVEELRVWEGPAAAQPAEFTNGDDAAGYVLPGGDIQVNVNPEDLTLGDPVNTEWQDDLQATINADPELTITFDSLAANGETEMDGDYDQIAVKAARLATLLAQGATDSATDSETSAVLTHQAELITQLATKVRIYSGHEEGHESDKEKLEATLFKLMDLGRHAHHEHLSGMAHEYSSTLLDSIVGGAYAAIYGRQTDGSAQEDDTVEAVDTVQIIGSIYTTGDQAGDFGWMLQQADYNDAFFIFNDNEEQFLAHGNEPTGSLGCRAGGGNAVIRPYQCQMPPRAAGIPTGANRQGYTALTPHVQQMVDDAIAAIRSVVAEHGYKRIYYSAANRQGDLGSGIFQIDSAVKAYIVSQIRTLAVTP